MYIARLEIRRFARRVVAVALGRARVSELELSVPDDFFRRGGIFSVVEIAEDDESGVRDSWPRRASMMPRKTFASPSRSSASSASGEARCDFRCAAMSVKVKFGAAWMSTSAKPRLTAKVSAVEQKKFVRVRAARDDGQSAQHDDMNVGVETRDVFPKRKIQPVGLERRAEVPTARWSRPFLRARARRDSRPGCFRGFWLWLRRI